MSFLPTSVPFLSGELVGDYSESLESLFFWKVSLKLETSSNLCVVSGPNPRVVEL